jgi:S-adenosylmethionine:tRNA-ribosyltransferase-isomerase (queuine synthetase)
MNQTKVLPARITLHKENDGKVKVVFLVNEQNNSRNLPADSYSIRGYVDRKVKVGEKHTSIQSIGLDQWTRRAVFLPLRSISLSRICRFT